MLAPLAVIPVKAEPTPIPLKTSRIDTEKLPEGDLIYMGTAAATLDEEDAVYEFPIYREGDLSKGASVTVHTLDMTAVYGKDYEIVDEDVEESGDKQSLLEMSVTEGLKESDEDTAQTYEDAEETETADYADAEVTETTDGTGEKSLRELKEEQTGEDTRAPYEDAEPVSPVQDVVNSMVPEAMQSIRYSSEFTVDFAPDESEKTVRFRIIDDNKSEGDEGFSMLLVNPEGAELYEVTSLSVTVTDNEPVKHSTVSFSKKTYSSKDGQISVKIKRKGAEYSLCTFMLRSDGDTAVAGENYAEVNDEVVFMPYETEKNIDIPVRGSGEFKLLIRELDACEEGKYTEAAIRVDEPEDGNIRSISDGSGTRISAADGDIQVTAASGDKPSPDNCDQQENVTINGKECILCYNLPDDWPKTDPTEGYIYSDEDYDVPPEVGKYYFSTDESHGGYFKYGSHTGSPTYWANGWANSDYKYKDEMSDMSYNHGYLQWYSSLISNTGTAYTYTNQPVLQPIYYQCITPHWVSEQDVFGGNKGRITIGTQINSDGSSMTDGTSADVNGKYLNDSSSMPLEMETGYITLHEPASGTSGYDVNKKEYINVAAVDEDGGKTPKSYIRFYGVAAMYKRFDFKLSNPPTLSYKSGWNGETKQYETQNLAPFFQDMDSGVEISVGNPRRAFFANPDQNEQSFVLNMTEANFDGHSDMFGKLTGYTLNINPGSTDSKVSLTYPTDFLDYVQQNYSSAYEAEKKKVEEDLRVIPVDEYFVSWIGAKEKKAASSDFTDQTGGYHQNLDLTPIVEYDPVKVTVEAPVETGAQGLGAFDDPELSVGTHENIFHAGDRISMQSTPDDPTLYESIGYEVSTDQGQSWNVIASNEDKDFLFLEPDKDYVVRPCIVEKKNRIEVVFDDGAEKYLQVQNLISEEDLEAEIEKESEAEKTSDEALKNRHFLDINHDAGTLRGRMNPVVSSLYTLNITSVEDGNYIYRPVITHSGNTENSGPYTTNAYSLVARQFAADNVLHISYKRVSKKDMTGFNISGTITSNFPTIRSTPTEPKSIPVEGYTVNSGAGTQSPNGDASSSDSGVHYDYLVDGTSTTSQKDGTFMLSGIYGQTGDVITVAVTNDISNGEVFDVTLNDRGGVDRDTGNFIVNAREMSISYPSSAPEITGVHYKYESGTAADLPDTGYEIPIEDSILDISFDINPKGHKIKKIVMCVVSTTGAENTYDATAADDAEYTFTAKIENVTEDINTGDAVYAYIVDGEDRVVTSETLDEDGSPLPSATPTTNTYEVEYPKVNTGLLFASVSNKTMPQTYDFNQSETVDIPIIGSAHGVAQSGKLKLQRINWDGTAAGDTGYTLQANISVLHGTTSTPSTEDKKGLITKFHDKAKEVNAKNGNIQDLTTSFVDMDDDGEGDASSRVKSEKKYFNGRKQKQEQMKKAYAGFNSQKYSLEYMIILAFDFVKDPVKNEYIFSYGTVALGGTFDFNKTLYSAISNVPVFLNITTSLQVNMVVSYSTDDGMNALSAGDFDEYGGNVADLISQDHEGQDKFDLIITGKLQVGVGICGVLSARGYVSLTVEFAMQCQDFEAGVLLTAAGGIGFDLLVISIDVDIGSVSIGAGSLANKSGFSLFGGLAGSGSFYSANAGRPVFALTNVGETAENGDKIISTDNDQTIKEHTYSNGNTDMSRFGAGSEVMPMSVPQTVSKHTLLSNAAERTRPHIIPLGDGRKLVTFIGNNATRDEKNGATLYYSVYDGTWSVPQPVADDGTMDSDTAVQLSDGKVYIAWADANRTVTENDATDDALNSFGISMAVYDVETGTMSDEITVVNDRFMNASPQLEADGSNVYVTYMKRDLTDMRDETDLTNMGYLYSTMANVTYNAETGTVNDEQYISIQHELTDPLAADYQTQLYKTGGKTFMLSAYTVDGDENLYTPDDRELYLGITDLNTGEEYFPIRITNNAVSDTTPQLTEIRGKVYLTWLEDGYMFDIVNISDILDPIFDAELDKGIADTSAYRNTDHSSDGWWIKTADELNMNESDYESSIYGRIADGRFKTAKTNLRGDSELMTSIGSYKLTADDTDIYVFYTEFGQDHYSTGMEIYGARMENNGEFTTGVQITDFDKVIDELDLYMTDDGKISAVSNYYSQWIDEDYHIRYGENELVEIDFEPESSVKITDGITFPQRLAPNVGSTLEFSVENDGLYDAEGYSVKVSEVKDGKENLIYDKDFDTVLKSGETADISVPWVIPENTDNMSIKVEIAEHGANGSVIKTEEVPHKVKLTAEPLEITRDGNEYTVSAKIVNDGNVPSAIQTAVLTENDSNYNKIKDCGTTGIPSLEPGEETAVQIKFTPAVDDFDEHQYLNLRLKSDNGLETNGKIIGTVPVIAEINGGAESVTLPAGETVPIETKAAPWNALAGEVKYYSSDNNVAVVNTDGEIVAVSVGTAVISAYYTECNAKDTITVSVTPANESGGETIHGSITVDGSNITVSADKDCGAVVIAADYDPETNKLERVHTMEVGLTAGETKTIDTTEWDMTLGSEDKIMLWNSLGNMQPLCGAVSGR